jgi:predicted SPOUT superfamily RNA methylase MTH1
MHPDLKNAAQLKSMDLPHHLKPDDPLPYREGVTIPFPHSTPETKGTLVEAGIGQVILPNETIDPYTRVTLDMTHATPHKSGYLTNAKLVAPTYPTTKKGYYWGYNVRQASSLSKVITECSYTGGYDFVIGTSERGRGLTSGVVTSLPRFSHLLIVLGGQAGIEAAAENDAEIKLDKGNISELFDWWVNCVPGQGSRTIRTEEAIWIILGQMFGEIQRKGIK